MLNQSASREADRSKTSLKADAASGPSCQKASALHRLPPARHTHRRPCRRKNQRSQYVSRHRVSCARHRGDILHSCAGSHRCFHPCRDGTVEFLTTCSRIAGTRIARTIALAMVASVPATAPGFSARCSAPNNLRVFVKALCDAWAAEEEEAAQRVGVDLHFRADLRPTRTFESPNKITGEC